MNEQNDPSDRDGARNPTGVNLDLIGNHVEITRSYRILGSVPDQQNGKDTHDYIVCRLERANDGHRENIPERRHRDVLATPECDRDTEQTEPRYEQPRERISPAQRVPCDEHVKGTNEGNPEHGKDTADTEYRYGHVQDIADPRKTRHHGQSTSQIIG